MANVTNRNTSQGLYVKQIMLDQGENAVVFPDSTITGQSPFMEGIVWTLSPMAEGSRMTVDVEYSMLDGSEIQDDEYWAWVPHVLSPFRDKKQEAELARCNRIRFTARNGSVVVIISGDQTISVTTSG